MIYINNIAFNYSSRVIDWIGCGGAGGCDDKQHHGNARVFDITRIQFSNGTAVDCRGSWEVADVANNRAYAALIASCRIYLGPGSALSAPIAGGHNNHIHIDTTYTPGVLSTGSGADRVILRRINRVFGGSGIAVSETPAWSLADQNALNYTLSMFGFASCYNIFGNGWHTIGFLDMVAKHGWGNKPPGYYPPAGC